MTEDGDEFSSHNSLHNQIYSFPTGVFHTTLGGGGGWLSPTFPLARFTPLFLREKEVGVWGL